MERMCELLSLDALEQLYDLKDVPESRRVHAEVRTPRVGGWHRARGREQQRLVVRQRDLVYARWVAAAAGIDTWPDETDDAQPGAGEPDGVQGAEAA